VLIGRVERLQEYYRERFEQVLREWKRFINGQPLENPLVIPMSSSSRGGAARNTM